MCQAKQVLEKVVNESGLLGGELSTKTVAVFGKYALMCERIAEAEHNEAVLAKYVEVQRKDAEKKVSELDTLCVSACVDFPDAACRGDAT